MSTVETTIFSGIERPSDEWSGPSPEGFSHVPEGAACRRQAAECAIKARNRSRSAARPVLLLFSGCPAAMISCKICRSGSPLTAGNIALQAPCKRIIWEKAVCDTPPAPAFWTKSPEQLPGPGQWPFVYPPGYPPAHYTAPQRRRTRFPGSPHS